MSPNERAFCFLILLDPSNERGVEQIALLTEKKDN